MTTSSYIIFEGNIGAGSTTLAQLYSRKYKMHFLQEQYETLPYLEKFYEEPGKHAFVLEMSFLALRFAKHKEWFGQNDLFHNGTVSDYGFFKSHVFASVTLDETDFKLFKHLFDAASVQLPRPERIVYLHRNTEDLLKNIRKRGRSYEQDIKEDYLLDIESSYFKLLNQLTDIPIMIVNASNIDFLKKQDKLQHLFDQVNTELQPGLHYIRL